MRVKRENVQNGGSLPGMVINLNPKSAKSSSELFP